jgi:hypothetical protein
MAGGEGDVEKAQSRTGQSLCLSSQNEPPATIRRMCDSREGSNVGVGQSQYVHRVRREPVLATVADSDDLNKGLRGKKGGGCGHLQLDRNKDVNNNPFLGRHRRGAKAAKQVGKHSALMIGDVFPGSCFAGWTYNWVQSMPTQHLDVL